MWEMKTIMGRWDVFLTEAQAPESQETLTTIKDTPGEAADLIKKVFDAAPEEQRKVWDALMADPEVTDAIKAFKTVAAENDLTEGALADKMLSTYIQGDIAVQKFFESPLGTKIRKYGGPVLALALVAMKLSDPPVDLGDINLMMKLAKSAAPAADIVSTAAVEILGT